MQQTKFAAHHVTPDLLTLAVRYVLQYKGDFSYLVDMKNRIATMGEKSITRYMAKGVLNCMLHDPNVHNLPRPSALVFDVEEEIEEVRVTKRRRVTIVDDYEMAADTWARNQLDASSGSTPGDLDEDELLKRNPYRRLEPRSQWKFDYGISSNNRACRVHIIDPRVPAVHWYPEGGAHCNSGGQPRIELRIKWLCKTAWSMGKSSNYELMPYEIAQTVAYMTGWDWCAACQRIDKEHNVLANREPWRA